MASGLKPQKVPAPFENAVLKWMNFTFDLVVIALAVLIWEILVGMAALIFTLGWIYIQERRRVSEEEKFIVGGGLTDDEPSPPRVVRSNPVG